MNRFIEAYQCYWLSLKQYANYMETALDPYDWTGRVLYADWYKTNAELAEAKLELLTR